MPPEKTVFCADIGTSSLKAALITTEGRPLAYRRESYSGPAPASWLKAFYRAAAFFASAPADAVVISGGGPTLVPLTASEESLTPLFWHSRGETPPGFSGPSLFLPKIYAFKNGNPAAYAETALFLSCQEWLSHALGAAPVTVLPQAAYEPFYWDAGQCAALGLDSGKFPPFVPMGSRIGYLRSGVSSALPEGTPIISGGPDFIMALIGTGVLEPGMICDRAGSSEGLNLCLDENACGFLREKRRLGGLDPAIRLLPHAAAGLFNAGYVIPQSGTLFEDYRAAAGLTAAQLMEAVARDAAHPARAALETMVANVRAGITALREALEGYPAKLLPPGPARLVLSGGQAKNLTWNRMKAGLTGAVLLVPEIPDGELAGDAVLGALYLEDVNLEDGDSAPAFLKAERLREKVRRFARITGRFESGG